MIEVSPRCLEEAVARVVQAAGRFGGASLFLPVRPASAGLDALAQTAQSVRERIAFEFVFLTGGDTAQAVCQALRIERLQLLAEIQPGVVAVKMQGAGASLLGVIKNGGFGSEDAMVRSLAWFRTRGMK
jgi:uncharacterized protein YgbK (DUF1537 family)